MANDYIKLSADECDTILAAREELAVRYGHGGRVTDGYDALTQSKLASCVPYLHRDLVVENVLERWDLFNATVEMRRSIKLPNAWDSRMRKAG